MGFSYYYKSFLKLLLAENIFYVAPDLLSPHLPANQNPCKNMMVGRGLDLSTIRNFIDTKFVDNCVRY